MRGRKVTLLTRMRHNRMPCCTAKVVYGQRAPEPATALLLKEGSWSSAFTARGSYSGWQLLAEMVLIAGVVGAFGVAA